MVDSTGTTSYNYDSAGRLISVTDSNGNTVTYGYNQFGQESCVSYPGFASADSCLAADNPNNGTNAIDPGEVWYSYDQQDRMSTITDWNGDAFTYGYDCAGDVAWLLESPSSQAPSSVTECAGSSGTPTTPTPPSGTTYVLTSYNYSSGGSGNLLSSQTTDAVTHSGSTSLLEFDSMTYNANNNLTSSTPKVSGTTETADAYGYDSQQRVTSGPETSGSKTAYSYANSNTDSYPTCSQPYCSHSTVDQMGTDAMPDPGASAQVGAEYAGNGELCWIGVVTTTKSGSCASPGSTSSNYETVSYNSSGDMTSTAPMSTYGSSTALTWNVDTNEPTCINPSGTSCTGPSSSQQQAATYTYNADRLRTSAKTWNSSTSTVSTIDFTWNTASSALLSNGTFDYLYGRDSNVPIAQIDEGNNVTGQMLGDWNSNVRGIVEVTVGGANPFVLDNYTDYDAYGNPITGSGGSVDNGGLMVDGRSGDADSATSYGFGGGYQDASGFMYLINRYYDSNLGQFLSSDPSLARSGTPYSYANDNPVVLVDPTGTHAQGLPYAQAIDDSEQCLHGTGHCPHIKGHKESKRSKLGIAYSYESPHLTFIVPGTTWNTVVEIYSTVDVSTKGSDDAQLEASFTSDGSIELKGPNGISASYDSTGAIEGAWDYSSQIPPNNPPPNVKAKAFPCSEGWCYSETWHGQKGLFDWKAKVTVGVKIGNQGPPDATYLTTALALTGSVQVGEEAAGLSAVEATGGAEATIEYLIPELIVELAA